jgi:hypothetical protein
MPAKNGAKKGAKKKSGRTVKGVATRAYKNRRAILAGLREARKAYTAGKAGYKPKKKKNGKKR